MRSRRSLVRATWTRSRTKQPTLMSLRDVLGIAQSKSTPQDQHPLWTLLGPSDPSTSASILSKLNTATTMPAMNFKDKTATSLRLLLCDAQNTLEGFSVQIQGLVKDVGRAGAQMEETAKLVEDQQAAANNDLKALRELACRQI